MQGPTAWAGCFTDECSFCLPRSILASALAPEEWCFPPGTENLISVHALGLQRRAGHVTVMQCPQLAVSQPGLKASVNLSRHRVTSGASGLQVLLLSAVLCSLSSLQSLLPALVVLLPVLQLGWTAVPKAGSGSRGVPATAALLSPSTPWACSSWLQLHQKGLDIPTARPHSAHMFQIPAGGRAEYTGTVLSLRPPGLLRRDLLDQVPSTTFKQLQTPQLGLELTLSSDFHISCGLDGLVLGYFGQLNHYLCTARLL